MERLKRLREPAAVVALAGLALHLVLSLLWALGSPVPIGSTLASLATMIAEPVLLLLLTALLLACWLGEPTPHVRGLTLAGLVLTAALVVGVVALVVASIPLPSGTGRWEPSFLPWVVAPVTTAVISLAVQVALLRRPQPGPAAVPELEAAEPEPEPVDPQHQPGWTPDAAVGTVWRRAGDAASERPATSWDAPGAGGGWWEPDPRPDAPAEPTRRTED